MMKHDMTFFNVLIKYLSAQYLKIFLQLIGLMYFTRVLPVEAFGIASLCLIYVETCKIVIENGALKYYLSDNSYVA